MTKELKKCPNCGHEFKDGEKYCPNCDLFIPVTDQDETENNFDPNETKQFNVFKESTVTSEETESEPHFKHRTKYGEETTPPTQNEAEDNQEIINETTDNKEIESTSELPKSNEIDSIDEVTETEIETNLDSKEVEPEATTISEETVIKETPKIEANEIPMPPRKVNAPKKNNKKKIIIGASVAVLLLIGGGALYSNQQKEAAENDRLELVSTTTDSIGNLYTDKDHVFLKAGITQADLDKASESLNKLKTKAGYDVLKEQFDQAEDKFNKQNSINELFKSPIINGNELVENVYVKNSDGISLNKLSEEKDGFDTLYNKAIDTAKEQKDALSAVEDKLAVVFKDNDVVKSATREQYNEAKEAIDALKDDEMKTTLNAELKKVDTVLAKAEKQAQAEEEAAALALQEEQNRLAALEAQKQTTNNNSSNNSSSNSTNSNGGITSNSRWGNRQDAVIDLSDPAWAWNPGIQNEVMSEVIKRGYVVDGGYSLVPKYIENGEGYYDLYATTNSKIFPNSKASEFPLFVVTINAKTGSFYGNGPN